MPSAFGKPVTTANRFGVVATPSAWTLVTTLTASNSASLTVTGLASTSYKNYALLFSGWCGSAAGQIYAYFSTDGGSTYPTGVTSMYQIYCSGAFAIAGDSNDVQNFGYVFNNISSDARTSMGGILYFTYGVVASARSELSGTLAGYQNSGRQGMLISAISYNNATEVNALRFLNTGGNITNGTIKVYGIT